MSDSKKLEAEKLQLEINELRNPFYKRIDFWKAIFPMLAIIATIIVTFCTGILDARMEILSSKKSKLELEILQFDTLKVKILNEIKILRNTKNSLSLQVERQNAIINNAEKTLQHQKISIKNLAKTLKLTQEQIAIFEEENRRNLLSIAVIQQSESSRQLGYEDRINRLTENLTFKEEVISKSFSFMNQISKKCNLSKTDVLELEYIIHSNGMGKFSLGMGQYIGTLRLEEEFINKR